MPFLDEKSEFINRKPKVVGQASTAEENFVASVGETWDFYTMGGMLTNEVSSDIIGRNMLIKDTLGGSDLFETFKVKQGEGYSAYKIDYDAIVGEVNKNPQAYGFEYPLQTSKEIEDARNETLDERKKFAQDIYERQEGMGAVAAFGGALLASGLDPANIALMPLTPGTTLANASRAMYVAKVSGKAFATGAAGAAVLEPFIANWNVNELGQEYTWAEAAANIGFSGGFSGSVGGLGAAFRGTLGKIFPGIEASDRKALRLAFYEVGITKEEVDDIFKFQDSIDAEAAANPERSAKEVLDDMEAAETKDPPLNNRADAVDIDIDELDPAGVVTEAPTIRDQILPETTEGIPLSTDLNIPKKPQLEGGDFEIPENVVERTKYNEQVDTYNYKVAQLEEALDRYNNGLNQLGRKLAAASPNKVQTEQFADMVNALNEQVQMLGRDVELSRTRLNKLGEPLTKRGQTVPERASRRGDLKKLETEGKYISPEEDYRNMARAEDDARKNEAKARKKVEAADAKVAEAKKKVNDAEFRRYQKAKQTGTSSGLTKDVTARIEDFYKLESERLKLESERRKFQEQADYFDEQLKTDEVASGRTRKAAMAEAETKADDAQADAEADAKQQRTEEELALLDDDPEFKALLDKIDSAREEVGIDAGYLEEAKAKAEKAARMKKANDCGKKK